MWFYQRVTCSKDVDGMANSLIWVDTVCPDLSVQIFRVIMVRYVLSNGMNLEYVVNLELYPQELGSFVKIYSILL